MIVSLTAYQRPATLARVMESFREARKQLDERIILIARVEPHTTHSIPNIVTINDACAAGDLFDVHTNPERLGLTQNAYWTMQHAWKYAETQGEDFVLHGEEDRLLAPDALKMAAWMRDEYRDDPEVAFITLKGLLNPNPADVMAVMRYHRFTTGWFGYWHRTWKDLIVEEWDHGDQSSFDQNLEDAMTERKQAQVHPVVSRSIHLWEDGEHAVHYTSGTGDPEREKCPLAGADVPIPEGDYWELTRV
jgi:hypothetical protein